MMLTIFVLCISNSYSQKKEQMPVEKDKYLTSIVLPQELLKIYADEKEKSSYYHLQVILLSENYIRLGKSAALAHIPDIYYGRSLFWSDYENGIKDDLLYYSDKMIDDWVNSSPEDMKASDKKKIEYLRKKRIDEAIVERNTTYNGKYKSFGGPPFLWKILDREKKLVGEQRIYLSYFDTWPDKTDITKLQWEIPELLRLKLVAYMLLVNYHFDEENVCTELIRRYNDFKPVTYEEWVVKEQMRALLRNRVTDKSLPELKLISEKSLNLSDEYFQWKQNTDKEKKDKDKDNIDIKKN